MEKNTLNIKLQELGAEVLKLHLTYPNNQDFGEATRKVVKKKLDTVFKQHYLKKNL